jgi:hypothetical protein
MICKWILCVSATGGLIIYTYAYLSVGTGISDLPAVALRTIFSTMRMFLMNSDYESFVDAVGEQRLQDNAWLSFVFLLIHVLAAIVIQTALLSIFGRKLVDYFRLRFIGIIEKRSEVFVIMGCDKNALILGENIATNDDPGSGEDKKRIVIFWISEDDDEKMIQDKVNHFNGIVQRPDKKYDRRYYLSKARLGRRNGRKRKYCVILMPGSSSAADDIRDIAEYAKEKSVDKESLSIYAFVSSVWSRERVQNIISTDNGRSRCYQYSIHIINIIDLLVRQMISVHPPYKCKGLTFTNGIASRGLTVIILGFGAVGESTLLHFIMNGQFLGGKMRAIVVDNNIDNLSECFKQRYPGLDICCDIEFYGFDVQCDKFYALLSEEKSVDYIVVTLNDDDLNKQIALDVRRHYKKQESENAIPIITVFEKDGVLYDRKIKDGIHVFGCREEILKDSVIIRENLDVLARAVHDVYSPDGDGKTQWHDLDWFLQESNRAAADFIPAMLFLANTNENDLLDLNLDLLTEDETLKEVLAQTEHMRWNAFHAAMGFSAISIDDLRRRFEKYRSLDLARRDTAEQLHACMVPWDDLDLLSEVYNELALSLGDDKEAKRNFKNSDRDIVRNIPKFLRKSVR